MWQCLEPPTPTPWKILFCKSQAWKCGPVIPALRRRRQEDHEFKASLVYIRKRKVFFC